MKHHPVGSYEETRVMMLKNFQHASATQKLRWLSDMVAFVDKANPQVRLRRLGLLHRRGNSKKGKG